MKIKEYIVSYLSIHVIQYSLQNHPVYIYANMHEPAEYINDCTKTKDRSSVMRSLFKTRDENKKPKAIPKEFWDTGYPKAICSKHSPVAVVSNSYGKLQNFPSNARLPVICGTGKNQYRNVIHSRFRSTSSVALTTNMPEPQHDPSS